ncbi:MAG: endonuclease/exonuclease/phosphatase family protein [Phycisphaerales bacterium]|nr:endonuclease/exonuclease/phosphatase family protein [Phycisphaerales bacterium]
MILSKDSKKTDFHTRPGFLKGFRKISWQQRKRLLYVQAWIVVITAYAVVAFAYFCPQDYRNESPAYVLTSWVAFLFRTFIFHLGLFLLTVLLVALWRRCWKLLVAGFPVLLIAIGPSLWQYRPRTAQSIDGETITLMSINLLMINKNTDPIIGEINAAQPDVLLLQEYTDHWHEAINAAISSDYPHKVHIIRDDSFGSAIYSRRPSKGRIERYVDLGSGSEPQVRAVIDIDGRDVALYNIHFLPPFGVDYIIETRKQFADLVERLSREELPVILAGDFNFTERTPQASDLRKLGAVDAQEVGGWGRGTTWPVSHFFRWIPSIRLDHIYLTDGLTCSECQTGQGKGSDHRPVIAKVGFGS